MLIRDEDVVELLDAAHPDAETVDVWYLELDLSSELVGAADPGPPPLADTLVLDAIRPAPRLSETFYRLVGEPYNWWFRRRWTPDQWSETAARPGVQLTTLWVGGVAAGYRELLDEGGGSVKLEYFGLLQWAHGRGLGRWWLEHTIAAAGSIDGATRLHLDTCSTDGPHAKANYLARGFREFRHEQEHRLVHRNVPHSAP